MDTKIDRVLLLKVPIDIVPSEELPDLIRRLLRPADYPGEDFRAAAMPEADVSGTGRKNSARDIVLLSLWDLLRARRNNEYRNYLLNAALVIPISKSLVSGVKFLTGKKLIRYMPFNFIISLLTLLERQEYSLYLLGCKGAVLKKAEKNIRSTFPRLKIIGRCEGRIRKQDEAAVIQAIRKASPSLLLAGKGIRGEELWLARNTDRLNSGLRLWCSDLFEVFAEKKRRPSEVIFARGLESLGFCLSSPLKFFRIFSYIRYKILLLMEKFF